MAIENQNDPGDEAKPAVEGENGEHGNTTSDEPIAPSQELIEELRDVAEQIPSFTDRVESLANDSVNLPPSQTVPYDPFSDKPPISAAEKAARAERSRSDQALERILAEIRDRLASGAIPPALEERPQTAEDLVLRPGDVTSDAVKKLPFVHGEDRAAIELLRNATEYSDATAQTAPTGEDSARRSTGYAADPSRDVRRLVLEVEVTLANAERIKGIATDGAKDAFKRLADASVYEVDRKLRTFRESYRRAWDWRF